MENNIKYQTAMSLLQVDAFKNLATLKHIVYYKECLKLIVDRNSDGWIILAMFPSNRLAHDALMYPESKWTVFISNSDSKIKFNYANYLPNENCVVKTYDAEIERDIIDRYASKISCSLLSYSTRSVIPSKPSDNVMVSNVLNDKMIRALQPYSESELHKYFESGAKWFAIMQNDEIASGCFIFPNHTNIWEIAGVFTLEKYRRKGYAETIVISALNSILESNNLPRYQVKDSNVASIRLAEKLGMELFLTLNHFQVKR
ncbi:MAG: GNAT family N-acetyltransferase [Fibrobacteres bacterium]|nr:GNAT family N-acetyltransferase [Fibrobacterota bacterium]